MVESSNPIRILLKWGWFEALISLRQSLNCLWPFRVLIWNSGMIFEAYPLLSLKLWIFFSTAQKLYYAFQKFSGWFFSFLFCTAPEFSRCSERKWVSCLRPPRSPPKLFWFLYSPAGSPCRHKAQIPSALVIDKCPQVKNGNKKSAHLFAGHLLSKYRSSSFDLSYSLLPAEIDDFHTHLVCLAQH